MNPDRREEIRPQNGLSSELRSRVSGNLPHWANPVLAARLTLATLTGLGAAVGVDFVGKLIASAQTADRTCRVGVRIESYAFFDMAQIVPEMGKRHILDMGIDPRAGSTAGFTVDAVPTSYKAGDREKPGYKPLDATTIVRDLKNNVGRGELRFTAPCNTTTVTSEGKTVPAVKFKLPSNLEDNDQYEQVVGDGRRVPVFYGSEIKKAEDFLRIVDSGIVRVEDFDAKKAEIVRNWVAAKKVAVTGVVTSTATSRGYYPYSSRYCHPSGSFHLQQPGLSGGNTNCYS